MEQQESQVKEKISSKRYGACTNNEMDQGQTTQKKTQPGAIRQQTSVP